jgi:hypothetical protein
MKAKGVAYLSPVVKISARLKRIKTVRIWWVVNLGGLCSGNWNLAGRSLTCVHVKLVLLLLLFFMALGFLFSFFLCFNFYIRDTCGSYWMFFYIYYCTNANLGWEWFLKKNIGVITRFALIYHCLKLRHSSLLLFWMVIFKFVVILNHDI